ncbi:gas vesicle protein [Zooshikella marina]|uniref:gas vesicle protein n=1 Tax=Zooshikella ganghwensis TaxID=202772 RepID=UPI001BAEBA33|nr:gas vesicle protein [Zooshikella ganghwensis]MBU2704749.1 gas vesicle protein [Zooshikella ganghwensis]
MARFQTEAEQQHISLCEALDRILNKGAVVVADISISVANIDLVYISLQALITSVETGRIYANQAKADYQINAEEPKREYDQAI